VLGFAVLGLLVAAGVVFRAPEPARAAAGDEYQFDEKSAVKVTMKGPALHFEYLDRPEVRRLGGRAFLIGQRVSTTGNSAWVHLPVDEVSYIEEYYTLEGLIKAHPHLAPKKDEPPSPTRW
jgi:hypothetical protein